MNSRLPDVKKLLPLMSILLVFSAVAVEEVVVKAEPVAVVPAPNTTELAGQITRELRGDPLFESVNLSVDIYNGLAIVHGGAPSQEMIDAVNQKLRTKPGIEVVYNYMTSPEQPLALSPNSIAATFDSVRRDRADGSLSRAFRIAGNTLERLRADPALSGLEFQVDSYRDLVILHGFVSDSILLDRAKSIAQSTDGVAAVLSYVNVAAPVATFITAPVEIGAPILSRPVLEPVPARFETIQRIAPCGSCRSCSFCR
jgi:osmotically-inducible protein OsmY